MYCPEDSSELESDYSSQGLTYVCPTCKGRLLNNPEQDEYNLTARSEIAHGYPSISSSHYYRCPRDEDILLSAENGRWRCQSCLAIWVPGGKVVAQPDTARAVAVQILGLFLVGLTLVSWQFGNVTSTADSLGQLSDLPFRLLSTAIWVITFVLIFLIPVLIYVQLRTSYRPHLRKSLAHPLLNWLPIIILILMAINIYFLS